MRRFLEELKARGPSTRADLSRITGVAAPTSSSIIAELLETGFLEEDEIRSPGRGRPARVFRLAGDQAFIVAVTIGPEECLAVPAGLGGRLRRVDGKTFSTPNDYERLLEETAANVIAIMGSQPGRCFGVGLSLPGLVEERTGRVALSPNVHCIDGQSIGPDLSRLLGLEVLCIQEEHALCLAEQSSGHARGYTDFAVLDITYGMGMGVVSGGRYLTGRDGFAGEIGHVTAEPDGALCGCGNRGCFETVATDVAFLNAVRNRLGSKIDFDDLGLLARKDMIDVSVDLDRTIDSVALAIAMIVNVFNPDAVLINSRLFELDAAALPRLVERAKARALGPSRKVEIRAVTTPRAEGVAAGLLNHVFAAVGPKLA